MNHITPASSKFPLSLNIKQSNYDVPCFGCIHFSLAFAKTWIVDLWHSLNFNHRSSIHALKCFFTNAWHLPSWLRPRWSLSYPAPFFFVSFRILSTLFSNPSLVLLVIYSAINFIQYISLLEISVFVFRSSVFLRSHSMMPNKFNIFSWSLNIYNVLV